MWNCERDGADDSSERRGIGGRPAPGAKLDDVGGSMDEDCLGVAEAREAVVVDVWAGGVYAGTASLGGSVWYDGASDTDQNVRYFRLASRRGEEYLTVGRSSRADRGRLKVLGTQSPGVQTGKDECFSRHREQEMSDYPELFRYLGVMYNLFCLIRTRHCLVQE